MRIKGLTRRFSGSRVSYTPGRVQLNVGEASSAMMGDVMGVQLHDEARGG
ncbi:Uncharacterised protein [Mycobacteroides abscessus subsp. abscessus]|nr:Uncharacterised protein [Mycobacteroides abscessus subsp. abscessus]